MFCNIVVVKYIITQYTCCSLKFVSKAFKLTRSRDLASILLVVYQFPCSPLAFIEYYIENPNIEISPPPLVFSDSRLLFSRLSYFDSVLRRLEYRFTLR